MFATSPGYVCDSGYHADVNGTTVFQIRLFSEVIIFKSFRSSLYKSAVEYHFASDR